MASFLAPPAYKPEQTGPEADAKYKRLRWQVFIPWPFPCSSPLASPRVCWERPWL